MGTAPSLRPQATTLGGVDLGSPLVRRSLLFSFCEGLATTGMLALNETFAVAAALSLKASPMAIAILGALPTALGYVSLYFAPAFADPKAGRKRYVVMGVRLQAILLFLCAFAGWLPASEAWGFIGMFTVALVVSHATGAFWVAWMGDLIPASVRGRHWAWRTRWFSCMNLACSLSAGFLARKLGHDAPWTFFFWVFTASSVFRFVALGFLVRQYEPPAAKPLATFSPLKFRPNRRFLAFSLAAAGFQGSAVMAAPFHAVWYLRDLEFNFLWLSLATSASVLGSIVLVGFWGRLTDRLGAARVIAIGSLASAFNPIPFLFVEHPAAICAANFVAGATWAGWGLASFNHILASTENEHRHHYIAFNSLIAGIGIGLFGLLGGFLSSRLPALFGWELRSLFLLSAVLRLALWLGYLRRVKSPPPAGTLTVS